jgi:hypothetical protein
MTTTVLPDPVRPTALGALAATLLSCLLAACGSGGGDASSTASASYPNGGTYAWVLRAEGATSNPRYALSLVHPAAADTELLIEPANAAVSDVKLVASASVDATAQQTGTLQPYALVYIVGGDVRRVPLIADGTSPAAAVRRAGTTSACNFLVDAVDHAAPERSRFIVSTAGADGACNTSDDGRAELRLDAALGLVITPLATDRPLAALRDPATLAPRGWLLPTQTQLWAGGNTAFRSSGNPVSRVLLLAPGTALVESAGGLGLLQFDTTGTATDMPVAGLAASTGWQAAGFDAQWFFVWRNSGNADTGSWQLARISRSSGAATLLGSGAGLLTLGTAGTDVVYATLITSTSVELRRFLKAVPGQVSVLDSGPVVSSFFSMLTSASGAHLRWRVTSLNTATPAYAIQLEDEAGSTLYTAGAGAFQLGMAEATRVSFNNSESRTRFMFVEGYGSRYFGDATLVTYDAAARAAIRVGALPGQAAFGSDFVFANVTVGPVAPGAGFASRSIGGVLQAAGARIFTFDPASANSLRFTTTQR